jgi:SWI/SNF-related matrix-associated actin-dependent regulator of chromatin subfamily A member 5
LCVEGCEKYGRSAFAQIAADIETKTEAEVREYAKVFWKRYKEIPGLTSLTNIHISKLNALNHKLSYIDSSFSILFQFNNFFRLEIRL